nr:MAG TPA: hypothetical protein [Caudoviricetes sp.]
MKIRIPANENTPDVSVTDAWFNDVLEGRKPFCDIPTGYRRLVRNKAVDAVKGKQMDAQTYMRLFAG